jgi:hypothetical protein
MTRTVLPTLFSLMLLAAVDAPAQAPATPAKAADPAAKAAEPPEPTGPVLIHAIHAKKLELDCGTCHVSIKEGAVELKRPGHDQCMACHAEWFDSVKERFCNVCHSAFPPTSKEELKPFPLYKKQRAILFEFSHARHVDQKARVNPTTGFRADCTFCHKFETGGMFASFPRHAECAGCHSQAGMKPHLAADSTTADCRSCHQPEEIENPGFTKERRFIAAHVVSGQYVNLKFDHGAHFRSMAINRVDCTTCHYAVPQSTSLTMLSLPKMIDCVDCHDTSKTIAKEFRMTNCGTCHQDKVSGLAPASHTRNVKPVFHTPSFRQHHEAESVQAGAKCFVCHQNVTASAQGASQCVACHQVMKPTSHTARWKDDIHGKYAAIDRESCATCHTADTCERCHNEIPRSHLPIQLYKAGTHMQAAMLNQRACFTCHTFQNTCSECHTRNFKQVTR